MPVPQQPTRPHKSIGPTYFLIIIIIGFYQQSDVLIDLAKLWWIRSFFLKIFENYRRWRECDCAVEEEESEPRVAHFDLAQLSGRVLKYWLSAKAPSLKQNSGHNILTMILILLGWVEWVGNDNDDKIEDL